MAKKNTKLIKKALKALEGGKVRLCGDTLKSGSSYCAVGFLTAFAAKHEAKKVEKALEKLGTYTEDEHDEHGNLVPDEVTGGFKSVEKPYDLPSLFGEHQLTDYAVQICQRVYGVSEDRLNTIVAINDGGPAKLSRVARLRIGLRALLNKKAEKDWKQLVESVTS